MRIGRALKHFALALLGVSIAFVAAFSIWAWSLHEAFPAYVPVPIDRAQLSEPVLPQQVRDHFTSALLDYRADNNWPSVSAAIGLDGKLVYAAAVGYAELEEPRPATVDSLYRIGSVSKSVTAVALGTLIDEGVVDIDADFRDYVPGFPKKRWPFTMRQLASHTAGVRHYGNAFSETVGLAFNSTHYDSVSDGLILFADDPLLFEPGTAYLYSSYGFNLLSVGLEAAAQIPFADLLQKNVFGPAGMTTAYAEDVVPESPNAVGHYVQFGLRSFRLPDADNSYKVASGGLVAAPTQLVYLGNRLLDDTLISPETRDLLFSPAYVIDSSDGESYGLGFEIELQEFDGLEVLEVGHGGSLFGGRVSFVMYPDYSLTVAVAINANPSLGEAESGNGRSPARIARRIAGEIISALEIGTLTP